MRVVIDLQALQTENAMRGIGRYSLSLTQALIKNRDRHDVLVVLSDQFPETILPVRESLSGLLPQENIHVWEGLENVNWHHNRGGWQRNAAELSR